MKGKLLALLVVGVVLSVPALAYADDAPSPAAAACKAEYLQIGGDAFKAKYGATDASSNCLKAHGGTTAPPATQPPSTQPPAATGPLAACEAEYKQIGADAFKSKYGTTSASVACIKAHGGTTETPKPPTTTPPTNGPEAGCKAEYLQLGADAFKTKYGATEPYGACIKAHGGTSNTPPPPATTHTGDGPEAACKAEYTQLGADAFKTKYGATEPYGACIKAHGGTTNTPPATTPPAANGPEATCKAEYTQLGADAFKTKYGATEPYGACIKAHGGTTHGSGDKPKPADTKAHAGDSVALAVALALCGGEAQSLGRDAFQAKYGKGKDGAAACVKAAQGKAQSILAACKSSTGDAFKQCVYAALKSAHAH